MPRSLSFVGLLIATMIVVASTHPTRAQTIGSAERFTAAAINTNRGAAGSIEIVVRRWSTDSERDKLLGVLREKGPDQLLATLQHLPRKGFFRAPGRLGWDLRFARRVPLAEGGERVILATDRRISFWETTNQPRSIDYPFTVIELHLNRDGEGEGKMSLATKITEDADHHVITLENYELQPVLLTQVKREPKKAS